MKILVTGGNGFIGSMVVRHLIDTTDHHVVNLDALTYAATTGAVAQAAQSPRYAFVHGSVTDADLVRRVFTDHAPDAVIHLAAETHVDRSIDSPLGFIDTNVTGTTVMLEAARAYRDGLPASRADAFRFLHVSTDEVYGSLGPEGAFRETDPYRPNSPYAASKAAADHMIRAWHKTYGLPVLVSNCSNNFGPYQFPEKLIPLMTIKALHGEALPVYGDGQHRRHWLYVEDHARGLMAILERGRPGETYNIGGQAELPNLDVVGRICDIVDELAPRKGAARRTLISHVADRPGHDRRYSVDGTKTERELGWTPSVDFDAALRTTVRWYLDNAEWWSPLLDERYKGERLGLAGKPS